MSHFSVTVCLTAEEAGDGYTVKDALERKLAPFDENTRVEPRRDYEDGSPDEYWWVKSVRRGAEEHRTNAPIKSEHILNRDGMVWRNGPGYVTPEENERLDREDRADDAKWAERLGEHPTWELVVKLYNEKYHPDTALAIPGAVSDDEVDTERLHIDEDGRAYTWTTYNPDSKWDWWAIGGRWQRSIRTLPGADPELFIYGQSGSFGDNGRPRRADDSAIYCDGGPVELLDFAGMRDEAEELANKEYSRWEALVEAYGYPTEAWERLCSLAQLKEITWDEARQRYNSQEIVTAAEKTELVGWGTPVEREFGTTREEYVRIKRAAAVPGYAMITLTGEWVAPGRMGWFGMSSEGPEEADAYKIQASKYLDELPRDAWVVQLDCHI